MFFVKNVQKYNIRFVLKFPKVFKILPFRIEFILLNVCDFHCFIFINSMVFYHFS